jgi:hypothetical protein
VQAADDGFVDFGLVSGGARRAAFGAVGDQLFAAGLHALGELGLERQGAAYGLGHSVERGVGVRLDGRDLVQEGAMKHEEHIAE